MIIFTVIIFLYSVWIQERNKFQFVAMDLNLVKKIHWRVPENFHAHAVSLSQSENTKKILKISSREDLIVLMASKGWSYKILHGITEKIIKKFFLTHKNYGGSLPRSKQFVAMSQLSYLLVKKSWLLFAVKCLRYFITEEKLSRENKTCRSQSGLFVFVQISPNSQRKISKVFLAMHFNAECKL